MPMKTLALVLSPLRSSVWRSGEPDVDGRAGLGGGHRLGSLSNGRVIIWLVK